MAAGPPVDKTSPVGKPDVLVSDKEREALVDRLRDAYVEGRLSHEEFGVRLDRAHEARTHGELVTLAKDLPKLERRRSRVPWTYLEVNGTLWAIWGVTTVTGGGGLRDLWPLWVTAPWGVLVVVDLLRHGGPRPRRVRIHRR